ncbi:SulP family inorganic anion transporter [Carboxylicivirga sediminis]|uniref:SulP family inorganic anion transporter n=1 Tax=Carboxylicivirga sediminis TaxID=2006564 RepID=A0A941IXZ8_9BACT|nr:SulP family inorganic anion transporter [Carboxylicivirga sediminis]MBR8536475.1 SulP family inorganic anion transporter [Carboxylicivirga sediminis]
MSVSQKNGLFSTLKQDVPASIVVFLVAVPLCLGIALASGAPLFSGIIAGIVGGIVVGALSGSQLGVSGPAAGLAVIVLSAINELGSFEIFLAAVVISGVIQLILGYAKAGIIGYYFPSSVIKGMLSGIGIIIILKQIPHGFGYDKDYEGSLKFVQSDGHNTLSEIYHMFEAISPGAAIITALSMVVLILWERPFMKQIKLFQIVQGPLVVVTMGILLNMLFKTIPSLALNTDQVVAVPVASSIAGFFGQFTTPDFSQILSPAVWTIGATIAIVASLETLLCLEATDKLDPQKRVTPTNRELKAQGIGNIISGFIGGLPITQVIVRSSTNIQSGGQTKMSAILHGVIMLICAMAIPNVLNLIPLASLAAILFIVGYKLAKPALFKQMYALGKEHFIPFMVTIAGIIFTDLLVGIVLGLVVAVMYILYNNYKKPFLFESDKHLNDNYLHLELAEDVTFINKASILKTLGQVPDGSKIMIDASRSINICQDVIEIIDEFKTSAQYRNIEVVIKEREKKGVENQRRAVEFALKEI